MIKALILLSLLFCFQAGAEAKFISVVGNCLREVSPDRGRLVLTAELTQPTAGAAAKEVTKLYEKLRADVKKMNLEEGRLQTTNYNVFPEHDFVNGKQRLRGYRAQMGLEVETSQIPRLGEVMEVGTKLGIQNVSGLSTFLSPTKRRAEQEACLEEAVKNARAKAEKLARAAGVKVGDVRALEEFKPVMGPVLGPTPHMARMEMAADAGGPGVEARAQNLEVTVYVTFALN